MDDARIGRALRVLRHRAGMRQSDVARAAAVSQSLISVIEAGRLGRVCVDDLRGVFGAVGASFDGNVVWRGAALDRLLDARHAAIVGAAITLLERRGWQVHPEVSYSIFGERGSLDLLGAREVEHAAVVGEIKSEFGSLEGTIRKLDEKTRLVRERICQERLGWRPSVIGRVLVLPDTDTARRVVRRHAPVLEAAFPDRGPTVRGWLRAPAGSMSGILFVPVGADIGPHDGRARANGATRVRPPGSTVKRRSTGG